MGNSNDSKIAIHFDRTNLFYFTGETVSGSVGLNIMQGRVQEDEIYIILTGEIGYTTTQTVSNAKGQRSTRTEFHHIPFYSAKIPFARPEPGQKELILGKGQYSWLFQIPLPNYLPPTMNQPQSYPCVRYYLQVVIDKTWDKTHPRETRYLTVYPCVNLLQNPQCLLSTIFANQNRKEITLKGILNKLGYVPGESIHIAIEIENPRRVLIQRIDLSMLQSYQIGENSRENTIFQRILPRILNLTHQQIRETFCVVIPAVPMPPSYRFQGGIRTITSVNIRYFLRLTVKVEGIFTNFSVDIPIKLGTEPNPDLNQQQTFNPSIVNYSSNPEQSMFSGDDDDQPPSYDSVIKG